VAALSGQVAALQAKIARLEGNITEADLVGSYTFTVMNTALHGSGLGRPPAAISTDTLVVTVTLNADHSLSSVGIRCDGARLVLATGAVISDRAACEGSPTDARWTYADGTLSLVFEEGSEVIPFNLATGGRFGIASFAAFHPEQPSSDNVLMILSRLK
jgi:hypothetical protein